MSKRKRRKFSAEFKAEIVLSVLTGDKSQAAICREHELSAHQFSNWKRQRRYQTISGAMGDVSLSAHHEDASACRLNREP